MKRGRLGWKWLAVGFAGCLVVAVLLGWRATALARDLARPDGADELNRIGIDNIQHRMARPIEMISIKFPK